MIHKKGIQKEHRAQVGPVRHPSGMKIKTNPREICSDEILLFQFEDYLIPPKLSKICRN